MSKEDEFFDALRSRTSERLAQEVQDALGKAGLLTKLRFLKEGASATVFEIEGANLVLKLFDARQQKNPPVDHSRFVLHDEYRRVLTDASTRESAGKPVELWIGIEPQLSDAGVTKLHQDIMRWKLWTEEGLEFWDHLPASGNRREIKNVMLDHRQVPYVMDKDAVKRFDDRYNDYPADGNGRRSDEQYRQYRADQFDEYGKPDGIPEATMKEMNAACSAYQWPVQQRGLFKDHVDRAVLRQFARALDAIPGHSAKQDTAAIGLSA